MAQADFFMRDRSPSRQDTPSREASREVSHPLPLSEPELAGWLRLAALDAAGRRLLRHAFDPTGALSASALPGRCRLQRLRRLFGEPFARVLDAPPDAALAGAIARAQAWRDARHHLVTLGDPAYPALLLSLSDPPPLLYVAGRLELLARPALAVVGSRHPTRQGAEDAAEFAGALAEAGWTVVSGLALGIDAAAHRAALARNPHAATVAVIGTGIDLTYPAQHRALSQAIAGHGAVISEWPLGTPARAAHFPQRNRLIAALARGVLVVEAALRSGSLITARLANELGREIFAVPGSIHSPLVRGCHALIRDGAKLVETVEDILVELPAVPASPPSPATGERPGAPAPSDAAPQDALCARVLALLGHDPAAPDVLAARGALDAASVLGALVRLEIGGWVEQRGGRYQPTVRRRQT
ncbi:DNA-processing protein DprA [Robbsia sp. Bb-Pol-6]|uniref:DNA-processing protein DprA n=1 Tax=Robbsia betulipollinis TaxID=2981849 RepID=A0ABT3ZLP9_9BURK|nr:DNA-processing protein DprA [Robbsia betulipollinis]MCY0386868.1 DNA-processing protein DprA [Robbsia betulipollinis]